MQLEIRHLQQFVTVAEELNFSRAAERLRIAQPALSAQIKRLEATLHFRLFERSTRQVRLTGEGEQLLAAARAVLEKWDDAMLVAASIRPPENARIALGISLRMHSGIRVDIQNRLAELGAAVTIDFTAGSTPRLIDQVEAGRLDAAVCLTPAPRPGLRSQLVREDQLAAALPTDHPLAARDSIGLAELAGDVWLLPDRNLGSTSLLQRMCEEAGISIRTADDSTTNFDDEFLAVATGAGIEVVSASIVPRRSVDGVVFVPIDGCHVPLEVVFRADRIHPALGPVIRAIVESQGLPALI